MRSSDNAGLGRLAVDQMADAEPHRLGRCASPPREAGDRRGEEVFEFEQAARRPMYLFGRHPADRAFVHADRVGDIAQDQRPQRLHAQAKEPVLLLDDLACHLEDRRRALVAAT